MEDTKSLLIMVLQKVFEHRPKVIEDTFQLIYNYNNGKREKLEYEKTLRTICELMNEELPSQILVYLLTMVDIPTGDGCQLPIMEKMQRTHNCLPESVRPHLLEYLRTRKSTPAPVPTTPAPHLVPHLVPTSSVISSTICETRVAMVEAAAPTEEIIKVQAIPDAKDTILRSASTIDTTKSEVNVEEDNFVKPTKKRLKRRGGKNVSDISEEYPENPKALLDICAMYVIENEKRLKHHYKQLQDRAWKMINMNSVRGEDLQQCYTLLKDLNKKSKWLRMIENDNITADMFMEEYRDTDTFLRERHMYEILNKDPFELSGTAIEYIDSLMEFFI